MGAMSSSPSAVTASGGPPPRGRPASLAALVADVRKVDATAARFGLAFAVAVTRPVDTFWASLFWRDRAVVLCHVTGAERNPRLLSVAAYLAVAEQLRALGDLQARFDAYAERARQSRGDDECQICMERQVDVVLACAHGFCGTCLVEWQERDRTCPVCREDMTPRADVRGWHLFSDREADHQERVSRDLRVIVATIAELAQDATAGDGPAQIAPDQPR